MLMMVFRSYFCVYGFLNILFSCPNSHDLNVGNKTKGWISKHIYVCVSEGKNCLFFGKFDVLHSLEIPDLRFILLPYYRRNVQVICWVIPFTFDTFLIHTLAPSNRSLDSLLRFLKFRVFLKFHTKNWMNYIFLLIFCKQKFLNSFMTEAAII